MDLERKQTTPSSSLSLVRTAALATNVCLRTDRASAFSHIASRRLFLLFWCVHCLKRASTANGKNLPGRHSVSALLSPLALGDEGWLHPEEEQTVGRRTDGRTAVPYNVCQQRLWGGRRDVLLFHLIKRGQRRKR